MGREKSGTLEKNYLFFLNKQPLIRHHDLLKRELDKIKNAPALIVLCKTWLTENDPTGLYSINGYQTILTKNSVGKKRRGIACFVNFSLTAFSKSFDNRIENLIITVENDHLRQHFSTKSKIGAEATMFDFVEHKHKKFWCFNTFWAKKVEVRIKIFPRYSKLFLLSSKFRYEKSLAVFLGFFGFFQVMLTSIEE